MQNRIYIKDAPSFIGEKIVLNGFVDSRRDHGKLIFLDVRDETGIVQVVVSPKAEEAYNNCKQVREEWVLAIGGSVKERPADMVNEDIETGSIEISASEVMVLNPAKTPPFPIETEGLEIDEEIRLKHRYVDLRRTRMQRNIRKRSEFVQNVRSFLFENSFTEIETPLLTQSTPEGARDFVVPSRIQKGSFYALPQSPQQYKQLLMASGFEKYFQLAKCMRDEDLRADRAFEHTQIDMEMSFVTEEDVRRFDEELITSVYEKMGKKIKEKPFPIYTYKEAMEKFGADKFDLRSEQDKKNEVLAFAWVVDFPFFEKSDKGGWTFTHNPFSMPKEEYLDNVFEGKEVDKVVAHQYDLVCNGYEIGSGSIRSHKPNITKAVFSVMGYSDEEIQEKFGHILEAFSYGVPPHGGIAHGIERLIMLLVEEEYLREVQAFPQTSSGRTSVMSAPSQLSKKQLEELGIERVKDDGSNK